MKSSETPPQGAVDVTALLDELDQAHAAATRGPWRRQLDPDGLPHVLAPESHVAGDRLNAADAALIVAAVNRLPELTAKLRALLALADDLESSADALRADDWSGRYDTARANANEVTAKRIRAAITNPAEAPTPRCKCSHVESNHSARTGDCWSAACGCARFRPVSAA